MKRFKRLFREAERIEPPADLWSRIEAGSKMRPGQARPVPSEGWRFFRIAASAVMAAGLLGLGFHLKERSGERARAAAETAAAAETTLALGEYADEDAAVLDPELMDWHADLGEVDSEAEEAKEVL